MSEYFVFHREWNDLRKEVSKNVWYELETLMLQLRFEGIDTVPSTIKNKNVRQYWVLIRTKVLSSMENLKRQQKFRSKDKQDIQSNTDFNNTPKINPNKAFDTSNNTNRQLDNKSVLKGQEISEFDKIERVVPIDILEALKDIAADIFTPKEERLEEMENLGTEYMIGISKNLRKEWFNYLIKQVA